VLNNPAHPYWNPSGGEHKFAVLGMKIAQEMLQNGGDSFVHINPDGSIEDEKKQASEFIEGPQNRL
jgi:hypothetical protein